MLPKTVRRQSQVNSMVVKLNSGPKLPDITAQSRRDPYRNTDCRPKSQL